MRIAFVLSAIKKGGGVRSQLTLANMLVQRGYSVSILVHRGGLGAPPIPIAGQVREVGLRIPNSYVSFLVNSIFLAVHTIRYDRVVTTLIADFPFIWLVNFWRRRDTLYHFARAYDPLILDETKIPNRLVLCFYRVATRYSYYLPSNLLANSAWTAERIREQVIMKARFNVIPNGVDTITFCPSESKTKADNGTRRFVVVGKVQRLKGLSDVLEALEIYHRVRNHDFELVIITQEKLSIANSYPFQVLQVRPSDDFELVANYRRADLFLSASWYEGFSMPPLEAMSCGVPVITTDSGGVREYACHRRNCLIVPARCPEKLADAIVTLFTEDGLRETLVMNGIETAKQFRWEDSLIKLISALSI